MAHDRNWQALWLRDPAFADTLPRPLFHKQHQPAPAAADHPQELLNRRMLLRKSFHLNTLPLTPVLHITADDAYRLFVNGRFVAEGPANSYVFRYRYDSLDLSEFLQPGKNVLAVQVFYQGLINRVWVSGDLRQGLIAELCSGQEVLCKSDASWRQLSFQEESAHRYGYDTQFAENPDARRLPPPDWTQPEFDDSGWGAPALHPQDDHQLVRSEIPPVCRYEIAPAHTSALPGGRILYDFATEQTGYFSCQAYGPAGTRLRIRHAEELDERGEIRPLRCNCDYNETWTLAGRSPDRLDYVDYKAFRYVELTLPAGVRIERPQVLARHYPLDHRAARFTSPAPLLLGVWNICARAVTLGAQTAFLDCPSREKGQYLGDMTVTAPAHFYVSGDPRLYAKALRDFADSAAVCPGLLAVAPASFMQEIADYSLLYPLQLLNYYHYTGDRKLLEELLPAAEGVAEYFRQYERPDGLIENVRDKWNLVDWPDNLRDGYDFELKDGATGEGPHAVLNAFYAITLDSLQEARRLLGRPSPDLAARHARLGNAFRATFFRLHNGLMADTPHTQHAALHSSVLALFAGLFPAGKTDNAVEFIRRKGLCCGVYFSYFVLKALTRVHRYDLVRQLLLSTEEHSWGNMLHEGATACFEAWGKAQKWNTSLCHPWAASPIPVLVEDLLGLTPLEPGFARIGIEPRIPAAFPDFALEVTLPTARLACEKSGETLVLRIRALNELQAVVTDGEGQLHESTLRAGQEFLHTLGI